MDTKPETGVEIPYQQLSASALRGVIESFILREGTDYGVAEAALESKIAQIKRQLETKRIKILFDAETESCNLVPVDKPPTSSKDPKD